MSRRCSTCSIQYPPEVVLCMACEERTSPMYKSGPDEDWKEKVAAKTGVSLDGTPVKAEIAYATAHPHDGSFTAPVVFENDRLWINHDDLCEAGYLNLEAGSVVWVNDRFYELQGRSSRTRMTNYYWWVEEIVTEGAMDGITPQMFLDAEGNDGA